MIRIPIIALAISIALVPPAVGQQVTVAAPATSFRNNYYENFGVNFGFRHDSPNSVMFFRNGGGSTFPAFGGFDPASQNTFGLRGRRGNSSWGLGLTASQGSSRNAVTTTPMLTIPNGGFGFINSSVQRPFVTGFVPVVNDQFQAAELRRQFKAAAAIVAKKRSDERRAEEAEYERYKKATPKTSKRRKLDPPLVMRPTSSHASKASSVKK
jgi:hypothetical protein